MSRFIWYSRLCGRRWSLWGFISKIKSQFRWTVCFFRFRSCRCVCMPLLCLQILSLLPAGRLSLLSLHWNGISFPSAIHLRVTFLVHIRALTQTCWAIDTCPFPQVFAVPVPIIHEVLHHRRSLQSSLRASLLDTLVRHPHTRHHLALPYVLYPPAQHLGLRLLTYCLGPYHYVLHPCMLCLLAGSLTFEAHALSLALHGLGPSLGPRDHRLPPLASPLGPSLVLYHIWIRARADADVCHRK